MLRDQKPTDSSFKAVLRANAYDPGPLFKGLDTTRFFFDAEELWHQMHRTRNAEPDRVNAVADVLRRNCPDLSFADLAWVCGRLVIEVCAPSMSSDLTAPGGTERLLLARVQGDIGAGSFPNRRRQPVDVAAAMIDTAEATRNGTLARISRDEILRKMPIDQRLWCRFPRPPVDSDLEGRWSETLTPQVTASR